MDGIGNIEVFKQRPKCSANLERLLHMATCLLCQHPLNCRCGHFVNSIC